MMQHDRQLPQADGSTSRYKAVSQEGAIMRWILQRPVNPSAVPPLYEYLILRALTTYGFASMASPAVVENEGRRDVHVVMKLRCSVAQENNIEKGGRFAIFGSHSRCHSPRDARSPLGFHVDLEQVRRTVRFLHDDGTKQRRWHALAPK